MPDPRPQASPAWLTPGRRRLLSLAVLFHVTAVFVAPWNQSYRPASPLAETIYEWQRPYLRLVNLDFGYGFFAPEPGPSHLIRYEVDLPNGGRLEGRLPDRNEHWPRLFYHRHFMLTDSSMANGSPPPESAANRPWEQWENSPFQAALAQSYAQHLLARHQGQAVRLYLVQHRLADRLEILRGGRLDDPASYRERLLINVARAEPVPDQPSREAQP